MVASILMVGRGPVRAGRRGIGCELGEGNKAHCVAQYYGVKARRLSR